MVEWQALEGIGGVATAVAVVLALVFGLAQIRQAERARRQAVTTQMLTNLLAPHVIEALERLMRLPDDAPPETFRDDAELRQAFLAFGFAVEAMGLLVYERTADLQAVDRQMGGIVRTSWRKVRRYVQAERATWPSMGEWWQWLVERMDEDPAPGKAQGAHVSFRDWRR